MNKTIIKHVSLFLILTIVLFSLSGCYSIGNIDHLAYAVAIGLDVGENNNLKISFQLSIPGGNSGSSGSSQSDNTIVSSIDCSTIGSGINLLNTYLSKEVNLSHCKVIVFSEELAYAGLSESIYSLMNNIQVRPDCNVIISRCNAEYFLKNSKPTLEKLSARYYEIAPNSSDYTGYTEAITLSQFFSDFNDSFSQCYAILGGVNTSDSQSTDQSKSSIEKDADTKANETLSSNGTSIENMGLAVFHGDKLVGELSGIETICHQMVSNKLSFCNVNIPSPFEEGKIISIHLRLANNTKNSVELATNGPYITSKISLEARILTMSESSKYLNAENIELLEKYINSYVEAEVYEYLYKISKEYNSDIDGFGSLAVKNFLTWSDWENYNWLERFNTAFFNVDVDTSVKSGYILVET